MIVLHIETPFASFRQAFARSFAETYPLPPPATVYGMLLSLVGEHFCVRHEGVKLAFAYKRMPRVATTICKLSRFKYGVANKQSKLGNAPDYVETLCGIEFLCWVESSDERAGEDGKIKGLSLENRILTALQSPSEINRRGVVSLGLSDDAVNDISLCKEPEGKWHRILTNDDGLFELPVWADHVKSLNTRLQRYNFENEAKEIIDSPGTADWGWTNVINPKI